MNGWVETAKRLPDENVVVDTVISDRMGGTRNRAKLKRIGGLWFLPDASMYVYYTPTHWKEQGS